MIISNPFTNNKQQQFKTLFRGALFQIFLKCRQIVLDIKIKETRKQGMKCQTPCIYIYLFNLLFLKKTSPQQKKTNRQQQQQQKNPIGILYPYFKILYRFTRFPFSINFSGLGFSVIGKQENRNKNKKNQF